MVLTLLILAFLLNKQVEEGVEDILEGIRIGKPLTILSLFCRKW
jgi:hypothetical protein